MTLSPQTLMIAVRCIAARTRQIATQLDGDDSRNAAEIEQLLVAYDLAVEELKAVYGSWAIQSCASARKPRRGRRIEVRAAFELAPDTDDQDNAGLRAAEDLSGFIQFSQEESLLH
ncbi:hypothetical protein IPC1598_34385 [Pseudomonas aeruginosa]|uniref:hypothetical protein n=1 Tax=Pseudomonas aeruginosa TaxID=287 RepID=UPI001068A2BD|nr:hypothetical protein [Pseudomonas aeruginosa]TEB97977.1 hypothetical protein IPC1598_34385 [Pseudomonas aeruginosa]